MNIEEVITATVLALYADTELAGQLFLKGGAAMRLLDNLTTRLSVDADFSIEKNLENPDAFFRKIEACLCACFTPQGYDLLDFSYDRKPKMKRSDRPEWWGGWCCEFKLCSVAFRAASLETRRRNALVPEGSNTSKIPLDISEHEYCGKGRRQRFNGVEIHGYTRELLVLEKLRAICQQHPDYLYGLKKNRARDFYDIQQLTEHVDETFLQACRDEITKVFVAKDVPLRLLAALWNEDFADIFSRGFDQVRGTLRGAVHPFEIYLEHVRFFVLDLLPDIRTETMSVSPSLKPR